jgi:hypothetical protein
VKNNIYISRFQLKHNPLPLLDRMTTGNGKAGMSRFTPSSPDTIFLASCYGVLALRLFNELDNLTSKQKEEWIHYLKSHQSQKNGLFLDPLLSKEELPENGHNWEYATWKFTFFGLGALETFNQQPVYPLSFLEQFLNENDISTWLEGLHWRNPWLESNRVMYLASFLIREWERTGDSSYKTKVDAILDWLDRYQSPETGFWGEDQNRDLFNAMAGAFHFYFFYFYIGRPVNYINQIIDKTLTLQQPDGLYDPRGGGGACLDLDAVDILVKLSYLTDYRKDEIKSSLNRSFQAILNNQNPDGGFCECKRPLPVIRSRKRRFLESVGLDWLIKSKPVERAVEYKRQIKWEKLRYNVEESNLWASWFRPLALALISKRYPGEYIDDIDWKFGKGPFIGWHDEEKLMELTKTYSENIDQLDE